MPRANAGRSQKEMAQRREELAPQVIAMRNAGRRWVRDCRRVGHRSVNRAVVGWQRATQAA